MNERLVGSDAPATDASRRLVAEGRAHQAKGDWNAAVRLYAGAVRKAPEWEQPRLRLAEALKALGRVRESETVLRTVLAANPRNALAHLNLGNILFDRRGYDEALGHLSAAATLAPDWHRPHLNLANLYKMQNRLDDARRRYDMAMAAGAPAGVRLRRDLLLPVMVDSAAAYARARAAYDAGLAALEADPPPVADPLVETGAYPFYLAYQGGCDRALQERLARLYLRCCPSLAWTAPHCRAGTAVPEGRRRIAVYSRFLYEHSIGRLVVSLLERLARSAELRLFVPNGVEGDPVRHRLAASGAQIVPLPLDLDTARHAIAGFAPHLLFYPEIGMDPFTYFLAFSRLAPVQLASYGHPDTTGIPTIDAFLSCAAAEPDGAEAHYSEKLVRIGGTPYSYARPEAPKSPKAREDFGLPEAGSLYFVAQNAFKVHPDMDDAFAAILRADPGATIALVGSGGETVTGLLRRRFVARLGPDAARMVLLPWMSHDEFMRVMQLADVSLDTFPFCGGNTTYQALAVGTPVVTLPSEYLRGRVSLAIYRAMGMTDCIASDAADYARIAVRLATEAGWRADIRSRIEAGCACIFDDPVFLDQAERFFLDG